MAFEPSIERIERRLEQYHGETREVVETMLVVVRESALASRELAIASRELKETVLDMRDEIRANTQAVLRLLDRFDDGQAPATG